MSISVVVTGGFGVLGGAVVRAFAARGDRVAVIDMASHDNRGEERLFYFGGVDLTSPASADEAFERAAGELGGIDILVNAVGAYEPDLPSSRSREVWARLFERNVATCLNACIAVQPHLSSGGNIVNVGAAAALYAHRGNAAYCAAKSAVGCLTVSLAGELASRRVSVNAVFPGIIDTPAKRRAMPDIDPACWTAPEAVADAIMLLTSHQARAMTRALLPVTAAGRQ